MIQATPFSTLDVPSPTNSQVNKQRNERVVTASDNADEQSSAPENSPQPVQQPVQVSSNAALTNQSQPQYVAKPLPPPPPPVGNINVITYLNDPAQPGLKNARIGKVKVKVQREVGVNSCRNRRNNPNATTIAQGYIKRKSGKQVFVRGTVHFVACNTGNYQVTYVGRKGYQLAKGMDKTRTITLNDDETVTVTFILTKKVTRKHSG